MLNIKHVSTKMSREIRFCLTGGKMPVKSTEFAAGYDLYANEDKIIQPGAGFVKIDCGFSVQLPSGTYGRIAPRSGLAAKNNIIVGAGVIDEDYRGTVCVLLACIAGSALNVCRGDRIAQMIVEYVVPTFPSEGELDTTSRGSGGFGSTGQ